MGRGGRVDFSEPSKSTEAITNICAITKSEEKLQTSDQSPPTFAMSPSTASINSVRSGRTASVQFMTTLRGRPLMLKSVSAPSISGNSPHCRRYYGNLRRGCRHRLPLTPGGVQSPEDSSDDSLHDSDSESEDEVSIVTVKSTSEDVLLGDSNGEEEEEEEGEEIHRVKRPVDDLLHDEDATDDECEDEEEEEDDSDDEDERQLVRALGHDQACSQIQSPIKKLKQNNGEASARYSIEDYQERAVTEESEEDDEEEEEETEERRVHFTSVSIRECPVVEGEHPCCKLGPALQLGWFVSRDIHDIPIDQFEALRKPRNARDSDDDCSDSDESDSDSDIGESIASAFLKKTKRLPRRNHRRDLRMSAAIRRRWLRPHERAVVGCDTDSDDSSDEEEELLTESESSQSLNHNKLAVEKPFDYLEADINVEDSDDDLDDVAGNLSNSITFRATSPHNGMCPPPAHRQHGGKELVRFTSSTGKYNSATDLS